MKTVEMFRDFDYAPTPQWGVRFLAGFTYRRVLETAARQIERVGAGRIVPSGQDAAGLTVDAGNAFDIRQRRR